MLFIRRVESDIGWSDYQNDIVRSVGILSCKLKQSAQNKYDAIRDTLDDTAVYKYIRIVFYSWAKCSGRLSGYDVYPFISVLFHPLYIEDRQSCHFKDVLGIWLVLDIYGGHPANYVSCDMVCNPS